MFVYLHTHEQMTDLESLMQRATALASGIDYNDELIVIDADANDATSLPPGHRVMNKEVTSSDGSQDEENDEGQDDESDCTYDDDETLEKVIRLPRRPPWTRDMSASELDSQEQSAFLDWRRSLARIEEKCTGSTRDMTLTPFEKNLQVWRQLWRVLERSDLVVQIVDARDPLMYRCIDLEDYVLELSQKGTGGKRNFLLLNKADMLPEDVRRMWVHYFCEHKVNFAFWSAKQAGEAVVETPSENEAQLPLEQIKDRVAMFEAERVLDRSELLMVLQVEAAHARKEMSMPAQDSRRLVVGLVGYPNVGKSSTINTLVGSKKTMVSATPGKTKHFQTLIVSDTLMLCDCPGLVFPAIGRSKAEMVAAGVLPVDRLTDVRSPVGVIAAKVSRQQLESVYNISLPSPKLHEPQNRAPTGAELIVSFALSRGIIAHYGAPDQTRAGRLIIKDYINGKLTHYTAPPDTIGEPTTDGYLNHRNEIENGEGNDLNNLSHMKISDSEVQRSKSVIVGEDRSAGIIHSSATTVVATRNMKQSQADDKYGRRAAHKFHHKGNRRSQPKAKANGYGHYDPYQ